MSYAGEYGPDETCVHDNYRPNCWRCNGRPARFAREYEQREQHVAAMLDMPVKTTPRVVYDVQCPAKCGWAPKGLPSEEAAQVAYRDHRERERAVLADWRADGEMWAEVVAQGIAVTRSET